MSPRWLKNGKRLLNADGKQINCDDCPCGVCPESLYLNVAGTTLCKDACLTDTGTTPRDFRTTESRSANQTYEMEYTGSDVSHDGQSHCVYKRLSGQFPTIYSTTISYSSDDGTCIGFNGSNISRLYPMAIVSQADGRLKRAALVLNGDLTGQIVASSPHRGYDSGFVDAGFGNTLSNVNTAPCSDFEANPSDYISRYFGGSATVTQTAPPP